MAKHTKVANLRHTLVPLDPEAFPTNMPTNEQEPTGDQQYPLVPYDAMNVLPTDAGYMSFFGKKYSCQGDQLPAHIMDYLTYQDSQGNLYHVVLGDAGVITQYSDCRSPRFTTSGSGFEETTYG